jgi:hypothetical protein
MNGKLELRRGETKKGNLKKKKKKGWGRLAFASVRFLAGSAEQGLNAWVREADGSWEMEPCVASCECVETGGFGWFCRKRSRKVGNTEQGSTRVNRDVRMQVGCLSMSKR